MSFLTSWDEFQHSIRDLLADVVITAPGLSQRAGTALKNLNGIDRALRHELARQQMFRRQRIRGPRRAEVVEQYAIGDSRRGPALQELRPASTPATCPREVYLLTAGVISRAPQQGRTFGEIATEVVDQLGQRIPPYAVRVPLRFWELRGILAHARTRYGPAVPPSRFVTEAKRLWKDLEGGSKPS